MKKMILATVLIALVSTVTFGQKVIAQGNTFSALGDYKIATVDTPFFIKGEGCKAYTIKYDNSPLEVTVVVCKDKKCKKYVVLSDRLSVQYVCNPTYFGIERLDKSFEQEGYQTRDKDLNKVEYFHQKVLCCGGQGELESTRLIAAYFPFVLNMNENMTADM